MNIYWILYVNNFKTLACIFQFPRADKYSIHSVGHVNNTFFKVFTKDKTCRKKRQSLKKDICNLDGRHLFVVSFYGSWLFFFLYKTINLNDTCYKFVVVLLDAMSAEYPVFSFLPLTTTFKDVDSFSSTVGDFFSFLSFRLYRKIRIQ